MPLKESVTRVYRYGCRRPLDEKKAIQLLGQAWLYRDDLRRAVNADKRRRREYASALAEAAHVRQRFADARAAHLFAREHHEAMVALKEAHNSEIRDIRANRGQLLDWGTYSLEEAASLVASKAMGRDPVAARHFDGTGRIGAFILSRDAFPVDQWNHSRVSLTEPDARGHAVLTIRVGPAKAFTEIQWPIKIHRALPAGGVVKQVAVQRTRSGHRFRWEALITVTYEAEMDRDASASGTVGVDVGWRLMSEGRQRVAVYNARDDSGEVAVDVLGSFEYADAVQAIRDRQFDEAKSYASEAGLAEHAKRWSTKSRLYRLAERAENLGLALWRERDRHLEDIEVGVRGRAMRRRLDTYRAFADRLARRYRFIALEDMAILDWVGEGDTRARERRRSTAGLYLFQQAILHRFGSERVDWVPAQYTSRTCSACEVVHPEAVGSSRVWSCSGCGVEHDQDENAARVIRMMSECWIGDGNAPRARRRKSLEKTANRKADGIATGDEQAMVVTSREPSAEAAE